MNWKLILSLGLLGVVTASMALLGVWSAAAPILYPVGLLICLVAIVKKPEGRYGVHGLLIGVLIGVIEGMVGQLFAETYIENNLELAEAYMWSFGLFFVIIGVTSAAIYGTVLGIAAWLIGKIIGPRRVPNL